MPLDESPWTPPERPERDPLHEALRECLGRESLRADHDHFVELCKQKLREMREN